MSGEFPGKILHLDPFSGAAGDMFLGLLVDLGVDPSLLAKLPGRLGLEGVEVATERVARGPLDAVRVRVVVRGHEEAPARSAEGAVFRPEDDRDARPEGGHDEHEHGGRCLGEMLEAFERALLPPRAVERARRAARILYAAEARVHGVPLEEVHLHEAGADDALVDIAGTCLGLEELAVARVTCSVPLPVGGGAIRCAHGVLPVPVPAVVEILRGAGEAGPAIPAVGGPVAKELVTPTGAALLRALVDEFAPLPAMALERIGHGAGGREDGALPNVLRGLLGIPADETTLSRHVVVLETALDDLLPQDVPVLIDRLLAAGARDAMVTPVLMKKGRPGYLLTVIADPGTERALAGLLLHDTPTLGVRLRTDRRLEWDRDVVAVDTPWGPVRVKRAKDTRGRVVRSQPEFDDCRRAADEAGVTPEEVRRRARAAIDAKSTEDPR